MSEFVTKLEGYAELEVSIIRATKINKVLKAILKLNSIPKEEEFQFKPRSQTLLDKWNKLLASEQDTPAPAPATANGVNDESNTSDEVKPGREEVTNGVKDYPAGGKTEEKLEEKPEVKDEEVAVAAEAPATREPKSKETIKAEEAPPAEEAPEVNLLDGYT